MKIKLSDHFSYQKLIRFVLPSIAMMIFTSIYGVIDGLFISNYAGKTAFAAINLVIPYTMVLGGMSFMIGTGGTALVSKTLGEGDREKANEYFSMLVIFTFLFGIVLSIVGVIFMEPVAIWLGATPAMLPDSVLYGKIVVSFTLMFMMQCVFQSFYIAAEKPKLGLIATIISGCTNIILDALFVAVFQWGIVGAALATGISQLVGGVYPLFYFMRKNDSLLRLSFVKLKFKPIWDSLFNGFSELLGTISMSTVSILYNFQLLKYSGEDGVSAYGVLMYVQFIFSAIIIGYSIGSAPIISFHYGANNHSELKNLLNKSMKLMAVTGIALMALSLLLTNPLTNIFVGYDETLLAMTRHAFRLYSFSFILLGINIFVSGFFTALNNGKVSAILSVFRTLFMQTIAVFALPTLLGIDGIWHSKSLAEIFTLFLSMYYLVHLRKKYHYV